MAEIGTTLNALRSTVIPKFQSSGPIELPDTHPSPLSEPALRMGTYVELNTGECSEGGKHRCVIATSPECVAPAWCGKCRMQAFDIPNDEVLRVCHE
jgi:hypothetical protein